MNCKCGKQLTGRNRPGDDGVTRCAKCAARRRKLKYHRSAKGKAHWQKEYARDKEKIKARATKWNRDNVERHRESRHKYRDSDHYRELARGHAAKRRKSREHYRIKVLPPKSPCYLCGAEKSLSVDHLHPVSRGGTDELSNLGWLCIPCNSFKQARLLTAGGASGVII